MYRPVDVSPALAHVHVTCKFARTCNKRTFAHVTYGFNAALRVGLLRAGHLMQCSAERLCKTLQSHTRVGSNGAMTV